MPDLVLDPASFGCPGGRSVRVAGASLLCPAGIGVDGLAAGSPGPVPGFRARRFIADRKRIKLMTRPVQLGVSAVGLAVQAAAAAPLPPAPRRGMFVGASPQAGDERDLEPALREASVDGVFSLGRFAREGIPLIHPLWLVRGLSNNVLGFASAIHDVQGVNASYCDGPLGGWTALVEGARAIAEGRADWVIAGGSDALAGADAVLGHPGGDGAAFVVLVPGDGPSRPLGDPAQMGDASASLGDLGAATWPVAWVREHAPPMAPVAGA
jgi:hypothetical protein